MEIENNALLEILIVRRILNKSKRNSPGNYFFKEFTFEPIEKVLVSGGSLVLSFFNLVFLLLLGIGLRPINFPNVHS